MAYSFRYLSAEAVKAIKADATETAADPAADESLLRAWEADLAAHQALAASKPGEDKKPHTEAIRALEAALTNAPAPSAPGA